MRFNKAFVVSWAIDQAASYELPELKLERSTFIKDHSGPLTRQNFNLAHDLGRASGCVWVRKMA